MITQFYNLPITYDHLSSKFSSDRLGVSMQEISNEAESIGFKAIGVKISVAELFRQKPLPCILYWQEFHFVVLHRLTKRSAYIADPARGLLKYSLNNFSSSWANKDGEGIALLFEI